jgi:fused signal recognition particle receptor
MFGFFKKVLSKTTDKIKEVAPQKSDKISKELLEEILLEADVSYDLVEEIIYYMPPSNMVSRKDVRRVLLAYFVDLPKDIDIKENQKPYVELIFGVNGAGKTTTIAKLANLYKKSGKSVMLGASDTFRAAAIEQLTLWAKKLDIPIVATKQGHDPSAVAYDTISSAKAKGIDRVIIDTAGRLQTQKNLSSELKKIVKICNKAQEGAPHKKILILDGTQGNSATKQALAFDEIIGVDALIITKLDGTAKGGALFSIAKELKKPILYIGTGEKEDDLIAFDKEEFVDSLLDSFFVSED